MFENYYWLHKAFVKPNTFMPRLLEYRWLDNGQRLLQERALSPALVRFFVTRYWPEHMEHLSRDLDGQFQIRSARISAMDAALNAPLARLAESYVSADSDRLVPDVTASFGDFLQREHQRLLQAAGRDGDKKKRKKRKRRHQPRIAQQQQMSKTQRCQQRLRGFSRTHLSEMLSAPRLYAWLYGTSLWDYLHSHAADVLRAQQTNDMAELRAGLRRGGILSLMTMGGQDSFLVGEPQISFFRSTYERHAYRAVG